MKENQHATKRSHLVEKQKDFSVQKRIDSQPENSLSGDGSRLVSNETLDRTSWSPNRESKFLRFASLNSITGVGHLIGDKKQQYVTRVRSGKERFGFKKLIELVWTLV